MHPEKFITIKSEKIIRIAPAGECYQVFRSCPLSASAGLSCPPPPPPPWWPRHNLKIDPVSQRGREADIDTNDVDNVFTAAFVQRLIHFCRPVLCWDLQTNRSNHGYNLISLFSDQTMLTHMNREFSNQQLASPMHFVAGSISRSTNGLKQCKIILQDNKFSRRHTTTSDFICFRHSTH